MNGRKNITITVCRTPEEVEKAEREFLRKLTPAERILLTWQLSQEQWELKGAYEFRFSRHHTRIVKQ